MKSLSRIDKAAFRQGEYVGYCNGAQRIRKCGNLWQTYTLGSSTGEFVQLYAHTLEEMNRLLESKATYQPTP